MIRLVDLPLEIVAYICQDERPRTWFLPLVSKAYYARFKNLLDMNKHLHLKNDVKCDFMHVYYREDHEDNVISVENWSKNHSKGILKVNKIWNSIICYCMVIENDFNAEYVHTSNFECTYSDDHVNIKTLIIDHEVGISWYRIPLILTHELMMHYEYADKLIHFEAKYITLHVDNNDQICIDHLPSQCKALRIVSAKMSNLRININCKCDIYAYYLHDKRAHHDYPFYLHEPNYHKPDLLVQEFQSIIDYDAKYELQRHRAQHRNRTLRRRKLLGKF